jgi:hypothetical protein
MKKKVIRLTESDIERLVTKILKEEGEENMSQDNPKDVQKFLDLADKYLFQKYGKIAGKIDTPKEKAMLISALAKKWGVDTSDLAKVKSILQKESIKRKRTLNEVNINNTVKKIKARGKAEDYEIDRILSYVKNKVGGTVDGNSLQGDGFTITAGNTGFNVRKSGEKKTMFGYDQIGNMTKFLKEAVGYDSPEVFAQHAGSLMGQLRGMFNNLTGMVKELEENLDQPKKEHIKVLNRLSGALQMLKTLLNNLISEMPEEDLAEASKEFVTVLGTFERRIRTLMTAAMAYSEQDFRNELERFLVKLTTSMMRYGRVIMDVDKRFYQRVQGRDRGNYGSGYDLN